MVRSTLRRESGNDRTSTNPRQPDIFPVRVAEIDVRYLALDDETKFIVLPGGPGGIEPDSKLLRGAPDWKQNIVLWDTGSGTQTAVVSPWTGSRHLMVIVIEPVRYDPTLIRSRYYSPRRDDPDWFDSKYGINAMLSTEEFWQPIRAARADHGKADIILAFPGAMDAQAKPTPLARRFLAAISPDDAYVFGSAHNVVKFRLDHGASKLVVADGPPNMAAFRLLDLDYD